MEIELQGITIGPLQIRFYSIMILSGLIAGVFLAQREARRRGMDPAHAVNIATIGAVSGIIGARLYHVFDQQQWPYYRENPGDIIAIWNGGIGIYGALAGALIGLIVYVRWKRLSVLSWFDVAAPAFLLGQAIGRWGNFFNQELFGPPSDLPWAIPVNVGNRPVLYLTDERFHPLFLYESLLSFIGVAVLLYIARRFGPSVLKSVKSSRVVSERVWRTGSPRLRLRAGDILLLYLIWYPAERFGLEFLRLNPWKQGGIPMAQLLGGLLIAGAAGMLIWRHRQAMDDETSGSGGRGQSRAAARRQRRRA